jgi:hypothetical protein
MKYGSDLELEYFNRSRAPHGLPNFSWQKKMVYKISLEPDNTGTDVWLHWSQIVFTSYFS